MVDAAACAFGDPTCPCQDGDACHYVDLPDSPAMAPPPDDHNCFAGPILEDRCAICGRIFAADVQIIGPKTEHPSITVQRPVQRPIPPLTDEELADIKAREAAATAGPWHIDEQGLFIWDKCIAGITTFFELRFDNDADAEFIAYARTDVPRLIADLRASRERIKELEAEVEEWKQAHRSEVGY